MRSISINYFFCFFLLPVLFLQCSNSRKISPSVSISSGAINGVFIERNGEKLVVYGDPAGNIKKAEMVLFSDFRRDLLWAGRKLVQNGSLAVVPSGEKSYFTHGDSIWSDFVLSRFHDYYCQTTKIGIPPVKVHRSVQGGDTIKWQDLNIRVVSTPGYTRGAVSYIVDADSLRFAFTGDLIYGDGKISDLYSFQDSFESVGGYHGYATRLGQLIKSLQLIAEQKPDYLIPARGPVISNPDSSIQKLIHRVRSVYRNYLSISAYRWYYPERMDILSGHVLGTSVRSEGMPFSAAIENNTPDWYLHFSNSNIVIAEDSTAFLIDCGTTESIKEVIRLKQSGRIKSVDGIFITHYHDDHTNFINKVVEEFGCPVYVTSELKDILENPAAYQLPCLIDEPITNLTIMPEGKELTWKDFTLTFLYFPGQTIYHDAVLFKKQNGEAIFCAGDSFTPSGIDDYCLLNRNLLHPGTGYFYCLDILKELPENTLISNQHVKPLFAFSSQQLDYMTDILLERKALLKDLFTWDNFNYGMDEKWVSIYPYGQKTSPGKTTEYKVKIFNHSDVRKTFIVEPNTLKGFSIEPEIASISIEPLTEDDLTFKIKVSEQVTPGVFLLTINIKSDSFDLREWSESLIEVLPY